MEEAEGGEGPACLLVSLVLSFRGVEGREMSVRAAQAVMANNAPLNEKSQHKLLSFSLLIHVKQQNKPRSTLCR